MEHYLAKYKDLLYTGDPEIRKWFLVENDYLPIFIILSYVIGVTIIGPALMKNRKPYDLRNFMIVFNFSLVVAYVICLAAFIRNLKYANWHLFCFDDNVVKEGNIIHTMASISWFLYILKYVEFLDTILFVLRKKQKLISTLHVTHHAVLPLLMWVTARSEKAGLQLIPLNLNAFVHVVMYSYYGLAAMGPSVRKHLWWKKYLTQLQIFQFLVVLFIGSVIVPLYGCKLSVFSYITNFIFVPLILYLFYDFYKKSYEKSGKLKTATMNLNGKENGTKYLNSVSEEKLE